MSSSTPGTRATSPDTGIGQDDEVVSGVFPYGTGGSIYHRAASVVVGVPKTENEKLLLELSDLHETVGNNQRSLDATQTRVQPM